MIVLVWLHMSSCLGAEMTRLSGAAHFAGKLANLLLARVTAYDVPSLSRPVVHLGTNT